MASARRLHVARCSPPSFLLKCRSRLPIAQMGAECRSIHKAGDPPVGLFPPCALKNRIVGRPSTCRRFSSAASCGLFLSHQPVITRRLSAPAARQVNERCIFQTLCRLHTSRRRDRASPAGLCLRQRPIKLGHRADAGEGQMRLLLGRRAPNAQSCSGRALTSAAARRMICASRIHGRVAPSEAINAQLKKATPSIDHRRNPHWSPRMRSSRKTGRAGSRIRRRSSHGSSTGRSSAADGCQTR